MQSQIFHIPPRCPQCKAVEPNEITDKHGVAYQCVRCGTVWTPPSRIETVEYGIRLKVSPLKDAAEACAPHLEKLMREHIERAIWGSFAVDAVLLRNQPKNQPVPAPVQPKALPPSESDTP